MSDNSVRAQIPVIIRSLEPRRSLLAYIGELKALGLTNDVWTTPKTPAEWVSELKGYNCVLVYSSTESFMTEFGGLFKNPLGPLSPGVFSVDSQGEGLSLVRVP